MPLWMMAWQRMSQAARILGSVGLAYVTAGWLICTESWGLCVSLAAHMSEDLETQKKHLHDSLACSQTLLQSAFG